MASRPFIVMDFLSDENRKQNQKKLSDLGFNSYQVLRISQIQLQVTNVHVMGFVEKNIDAGLSTYEVMEKLEELEREHIIKHGSWIGHKYETRNKSGCLLSFLIIIAPTILLSLLIFA